MQSKGKVAVKKLFFETERLVVRPMQDEDRDFFVSLHTDEKIMKHNGGVNSFDSAARKFESAVNYNNENSLKFKTLIILDASTNQHLGVEFLFQSQQQFESSIVETGIVLARHAQGKQVPEEAISGLITYVFDNLETNEVVAQFSKANLATKRFVTKLGFSFDDSLAQPNAHYIRYGKQDWLARMK